MNVNLVLSILFLVMIEICFGLNFDNAQLCVVSFCFGYYLGKRRPPQVYVEINNCIFRLKNWKKTANLMQNLEISKYSFLERFNNRDRLSTKGRT